MSPSRVTFVIATYRRPDALRGTLRSLLLQEHADWTAIVIGDACGEETEDAVRSVSDLRIRYYNLPRRCGEQSLPNTAGLHLADGEFVSFLNHDDLLLADHLVHALSELGKGGADVYIGKFANATRLTASSGAGSTDPVFTGILPDSRDLRLLTTHYGTFDPSSFWLIRTPYARAVGEWRPALALWRTPLDDWLLRAWRLGGGFVFGSLVTGLRLWTHNARAEGPTYAHASPEHDVLLRRLESESPDQTRAFVRRQLEGPDREASGPRRASFADTWRAGANGKLPRALREVTGRLYLGLGIDALGVAFRILGRRGGGLETISRSRTGQPLPGRPSIEEFLENPEAHRVV